MKYAANKSGIIAVNKPAGLTSRDVVGIVQKTLNTKAGHTGTLDPMAKGVLVVCLGKATKVAEVLTSTFKEYQAEITLGIETDTLDSEGTVLKAEQSLISKDKIINALKHFTTTYEQEVPKYSAVKVNGKKLYEYARNGEDVVLPKKNITVYELDLLDYWQNENNTIFKIHCKVSKGTYIRSLIRDISYYLNTIGIMSDLIRTKQGKFNIEDTYTLEEIKSNNYKIIPIKNALDIPVKSVTDDIKLKILNGQKLKSNEDQVIFTDKEGKELAIYQRDNDELRMWKMLYENDK